MLSQAQMTSSGQRQIVNTLTPDSNQRELIPLALSWICNNMYVFNDSENTDVCTLNLLTLDNIGITYATKKVVQTVLMQIWRTFFFVSLIMNL